MTICPHCGRDTDALAWNPNADPVVTSRLWLAFQGHQDSFADAYKRAQGMNAQAWQHQMMRQSFNNWPTQYQPPVTPPKPWESGWRDKQSEWEKIP